MLDEKTSPEQAAIAIAEACRETENQTLIRCKADMFCEMIRSATALILHLSDLPNLSSDSIELLIAARAFLRREFEEDAESQRSSSC